MLRILNLNSDWAQRCQDTLALVKFYGIDGTRYEDSRIVDMINSTAVPKPNVMDKFLELLHTVDCTFTEDTLGESALLHDINDDE